MKLWICGKLTRDGGLSDAVWEFQGVFDAEERAVAACRDETYFIAPADLNQEMPDTVIPWPGKYHPLEQDG